MLAAVNFMKMSDIEANIKLNEVEFNTLRRIRDHFGHNDETMFSHLAFKVVDDLMNQIRPKKPTCEHEWYYVGEVNAEFCDKCHASRDW